MVAFLQCLGSVVPDSLPGEALASEPVPSPWFNDTTSTACFILSQSYPFSSFASQMLGVQPSTPGVLGEHSTPTYTPNPHN